MSRTKGLQKSGGRQKGTLNKATREIKALAQQYAPEALKELARLVKHAQSESARVAAIKELLDRAYGKAPQAVTANVESEVTVSIDDLRDSITRKLKRLSIVRTSSR